MKVLRTALFPDCKHELIECKTCGSIAFEPRPKGYNSAEFLKAAKKVKKHLLEVVG